MTRRSLLVLAPFAGSLWLGASYGCTPAETSPPGTGGSTSSATATSTASSTSSSTSSVSSTSSSSSGTGGSQESPLTHLWSGAYGVSGGGSGAAAIAVDPSGEIVVVGSFDGALDFGLPGGALTAKGGVDLFIARLGASGKPIWAASFGAAGDERAEAVALDKSGHIYLSGSFTGSFALGPATLTSAGGKDAFVAELAADGTPIAAIALGDAADQEALAVAVDPTGQVIAGGNFAGSIAAPGGPMVASSGSQALFVARLAPDLKSGTLVPSTGAGTHSLGALAVDSKGAIVFTGSFDGAMTVAGKTVNAVNGLDLVVGKLDPATLSAQWMRSYDGAATDRGTGVALTATGEILVTGLFGGALTYGPVTVCAPPGKDEGLCAATGKEGILLGKSASNGFEFWAYSFGEILPSAPPPAIAVSPEGNLFLAGSFNGGLTIGKTLMSCPDVGDAFLGKLDSSANPLAARAFPGFGLQILRAVAFQPSGDVVIAGSTTGAIDLGAPKPVGTISTAITSPFVAVLTP